MLTNLGCAHRSPTDPVPRGAVGRSQTPDPGLASSIREGGDVSWRLAGSPPVAWGTPSPFEGGPSRYTHLLHVNFQDAGWCQETSQEVHAELFLARFPARGVKGGGARRVDYRVSSYVSGRLGIRHLQQTNTALLTKWVHWMIQSSGDLVSMVLRDGYGSSLNWEFWRTPRRGDSSFMSSVRLCFSLVQNFF